MSTQTGVVTVQESGHGTGRLTAHVRWPPRGNLQNMAAGVGIYKYQAYSLNTIFTVGFVSNFKKSSTSFVVFVDIIFLEITFLHGDLGNTSLQKKKSYMESGAYVQYFEIVTLAIVTFAIEGEKIKPFKIRIYDLQINSHTYINSLC